MAYQNRENLAYATVAVAPSPALSGTSLTVANGLGSLFPAANFQITVYPPGVDPLMSNAEICTVTSRTGDVFTIVRAQEGTAAKSIATGWQVANTITKKAFTDIQDSIIQSIWAGGVAVTAPQVSFSNSNGVTFGAAGSVITASVVTGGGGTNGSINFSAGTQSSNLNSIVFSNSNGVSFGLSNGTMTASAAGAAQSTQPVAASASNGSFLFSTLGFSNANNVTFGTSAGSIITASVNAGAGGAGISAGTQSVSTGTVVFSNSNGVTFGMAGSSRVTASHDGLTSQSNQAFSAQGGSSAFQTLNFADSNGVTFINSNGSVVASHDGLTSQSNQAASASNGSFAFQTLAFSNANNVTFGTSAGSIITASVNTAAAGNVVNFSAGTTSNNLGSIVFSNANGVSFGLNGSTITASVSTGTAAGAMVSAFSPPWQQSGMATASLLNSGVVYVCPFDIPVSVSASRLNFYINYTGSLSAGNNSGSCSAGIGMALYTRDHTGANSTIISLLTSYFVTVVSMTRSSNTQFAATHYIGLSNATSHSTSQFATTDANASTYLASSLVGLREIAFPVDLTLSPDRYWIAHLILSSTGAGFGNSISMLHTSVGVQPNIVPFGVVSSATNASAYRRDFGHGFYSAVTTAFPVSIDIVGTEINANVAQTLPHFDIFGFATSTNIL